MEDGDPVNREPAERQAARDDDSDRYQPSGMTVLFWILVAILVLIGTCVLVSLLLVSLKGA